MTTQPHPDALLRLNDLIEAEGLMLCHCPGRINLADDTDDPSAQVAAHLASIESTIRVQTLMQAWYAVTAEAWDDRKLP